MVLSENAEELPLADMEKSKPTRKKMEWGEKKDRVRGTNKTKEKHTQQCIPPWTTNIQAKLAVPTSPFLNPISDTHMHTSFLFLVL